VTEVSSVEQLMPMLATRAALEAPPDFLENLPVAIYACAADGRIRWYNSRAVELWGRTPRTDDIVERFCGSYRLYFEGRLIGRDECPMAHVLRTGEAVRGVEAKVERPDATCIWATVHIEPVTDEDGTLVGAINCFYDTSALHAAEERLTATHDYAAVGIVEVDVAGQILRANPHLCDLMGYSADDLVGRSIFGDTHAADIEADREQLRRQAAGEIDRYRIEKRIRKKGGGYFWAAVASSSVRDADGKFRYAVRIQHDITDRKLAQEALARRLEEVSALHELTDRLQHSTSVADVYQPALDAILRALQCQRASIQLFDESGTMAFVSWRGLSPQYRHAIAGTSPWPGDVKNPRPICIEDIRSFEAPATLTRAVIAEGIGALAFVPILDMGRLLGKFVVYYDAPHVFAAAEIETAVTISRQLAFGLERLRREQALRESESLLRARERELQSIIDQTPFMLMRCTRDLRYRFMSHSYAAMLGLRPDDAIGKTIAEVIGEEALNTIHPHIEKALAGNRVEYESEVPYRGAGKRFVRAVYTPERDETGAVTGWVASILDITQQKRAEQVRDQLAAIVDSSDDAIISKDLDDIILSWNDGARRVYGYTAAEAIGQPIAIVIPPELQHEEPELLERIRRGERIEHYETVRRRKNGSLVDISLTVSPVKGADGRVIGASKISRDISERKLAERRLRESERRLQDLLAAVPAAIYTTDAEGRITYYNQAAVELCGRTPKLGSDRWSVAWKLYWPDGTPLPHDQCPLAIALREGRAIRNMEIVAERPDGTRVPFLAYPTPICDENGNVVGAINMLADVSERKQAETQQRVLLNELNHRVKNNMQMMQSLLTTAARRASSPEARRVLDEAGGRIAAMAAAQQVLYGTNEGTQYSAQEFIRSVCRTAQQTFPSDVAIDCAAAPGELSNDTAVPLALILNELLTNAVKHGRGARDGRIRVGLTRETESIVLYVEDDGPGFDLEAVRNQCSGLRLVQGLARQLGGKFDVVRIPTTRCSVEFPS
jgi:PAS domain S-box-containing protein